MLDSKKRIITSISILACVLLTLLGVTYAYYVANVTGNLSLNPSLILKSGFFSINYKDGTSSINGGNSSGTTEDLEYTKNFTITNDGVADSNFGVWLKDFSVYTYSYDEEGNQLLNEDGTPIKTPTTFERQKDWTYILKSGDTIITSGILPQENDSLLSSYPLSVGESKNLTLIVKYDYITEEEGGTDQSADAGKMLSFTVAVSQANDNLVNAQEGTLLYAINSAYESGIIRNESDLTTIPGQEVSLENEKILATTEDDFGTSYYYRGNIDNNYVSYSGMCWRIVRVQGDGTIKLVLADGNNTCENGYDPNDEDSAFVTDEQGNLISVPYRTTLQNDLTDALYATSDIAVALDNWVERTNKPLNLNDLMETNWCNDTAILDEYITNYSNGTKDTTYLLGANARLAWNIKQPSLKCNFKGMNNTESSKYIGKYAILTADESTFAGIMLFNNVNNNYLTQNAESNYYNLMSPSATDSKSTENMSIFNISQTLMDSIASIKIAKYIRPAIVLKKDVEIQESFDATVAHGTYQNPYIIIETTN